MLPYLEQQFILPSVLFAKKRTIIRMLMFTISFLKTNLFSLGGTEVGKGRRKKDPKLLKYYFGAK